ncbi:nitroreductase [Mycolicibacterium sp. 624]
MIEGLRDPFHTCRRHQHRIVAWRFIVLDAPEQRSAVATAAAKAPDTIETIYGMHRPADDDQGRAARNNRATYELHDRAGEYTSVLFTAFKTEFASEYLRAGSIYPAMQNFHLAARAQGLGACFTSWVSYDGEQVLREAVGIPDEWFLAGHVVVGWPRGHHGPVRRRPIEDVVFRNQWDPNEPTSSTAEAPVPDAADRRDRA